MNRKRLILGCVVACGLLGSANAQFASFSNFGEVVIDTPGVDETIDLLVVDIALGQLGSSFQTRAVADQVFADIDQAAFQAGQDIRNELLADPDVTSVTYSLVDILPLNLNLTQNNNAVTGTISGLRVRVGGSIDPNLDNGGQLFCQELDFDVEISNVSVGVSANLITGQLTRTSTSFDLDVDRECSGLFSFVTNLLINNSFLAGIIDILAFKAVQGGLNSAVEEIAMQEVFGLDDLIPEIRTALPQYPNLSPAARNLVDGALADASDFLANLNINSGKTLNINLSQRQQITGGELGFFLTLTWNVFAITTNF
ncbi:MAG: hypothetical protein AAFX75_08425 [Pseudomonadota bacterium]